VDVGVVDAAARAADERYPSACVATAPMASAATTSNPINILRRISGCS
jgi:hypothetical protein